MRIIGKITLAALALIALAAAAFWIWLPTDQILRIAADQVRAATGRELSVAGAARPSLWPDLGAEVAGVSLSNAPWADGPAMVTAEAAQISVAIWPLLSGDVQVTGLRLIRPNVSLEINADGQRNWDMAGNAAPGAARRIGI
ncbi:MAG: AsmA protein, partial [Planctomycetota bacterium]